MTYPFNAIIVLIPIIALGCQPSHSYPGAKTENEEVVTASGLRYIDMVPGTGEEAGAGMQVTVHYTGYLMEGKKFASSLDSNEPLPFHLGAGEVIQDGMKG